MQLITQLKGVKRMLRRLRYRAAGTPPPEFWRALLMVQNDWNSSMYYRKQYRPLDNRPTAKEKAHQILDCWLDVAFDEQWLDEHLWETFAEWARGRKSSSQ